MRDHAERGADVIKLMASGGIMTPGTREDRAQFSAAELRAAVDEAHRRGLPVTAHAHGTQAIADATAAGVDGMEHVTFWSADGVDTPPESLLRQIAGKGIVVGATAGFAPAEGAELDPATARRMPQIIANLVRLYQAGAPVVAGTDAGISPLKPHDVLRHAVAEFGWIASALPRPCKRSRPPPQGCAGWRTARAALPPATTPTCSPSTATPSPTPKPSTTSAPSTPPASPSTDLQRAFRPPRSHGCVVDQLTCGTLSCREEDGDGQCKTRCLPARGPLV